MTKVTAEQGAPPDGGVGATQVNTGGRKRDILTLGLTLCFRPYAEYARLSTALELLEIRTSLC